LKVGLRLPRNSMGLPGKTGHSVKLMADSKFNEVYNETTKEV
jgi:hypothetical protein